MHNTTQLNLDELVEELESLPVSSGFVHLLERPSALDKSNSELPLIPRSIKACIQHKIMQGSLPPTLTTIKSYGVEFIEGISPTAVEKKAIEEETRLQASLARWHKERQRWNLCGTVQPPLRFGGRRGNSARESQIWGTACKNGYTASIT